jgi:hypothetical protein
MRYYYHALRRRTDAVAVNTVALENIREWIAAPMEWAFDDEGRRRRQTFSRRHFRVSDILTHAFDVPKGQQPREEGRIRRALGALGYMADDEGRMFLPSAGARTSHLQVVPSNDTSSDLPAGYEDYGVDVEDILRGV